MDNLPNAPQTGDSGGNVPQIDPAEQAAEAVRRQLSGHLAMLQQQLQQQNQQLAAATSRVRELETADLDDLGRAHYAAQEAQREAAALRAQMQQFALQQQKAQDVQVLAGMFREMGVEVNPADLMDATDVMDAVKRAASAAKAKIPMEVQRQAQRIAASNDANAVHLGGSGKGVSADDELAAAKRAGDPVAALRAIYRQG